MKRIFSTNYPDSYTQRKFEEFLEAKDFENAAKTLESIPLGYDYEEKINCLLTKKEGYKALYNHVLGENKRYQELCSKEHIEEKLEELQRLADLAGVGDISKTISALLTLRNL